MIKDILSRMPIGVIGSCTGPFEGKRVNRPVANFSQCNRLISSYVNKRLHDDFFTVYEAIKKRPIYMEVYIE